jgi:hypothetical protein
LNRHSFFPELQGAGCHDDAFDAACGGALLLSEMKEFAGFPKATQRYIRRSLDIAFGRRDALECWARDEGEAASIRAQIAGSTSRIEALRMQVPDDSGLDTIDPFMGHAGHHHRI